MGQLSTSGFPCIMVMRTYWLIQNFRPSVTAQVAPTACISYSRIPSRTNFPAVRIAQVAQPVCIPSEFTHAQLDKFSGRSYSECTRWLKRLVYKYHHIPARQIFRTCVNAQVARKLVRPSIPSRTTFPAVHDCNGYLQACIPPSLFTHSQPDKFSGRA